MAKRLVLYNTEDASKLGINDYGVLTSDRFDSAAPAIVVTADSGSIIDAADGRAYSVVTTFSPKLDNGSFAPNPSGGSFVPWSDAKLTVNGSEYIANITDELYIGSFEWVTGKTEIIGARIYQANEIFELHSETEPGTNSQGLKYIRLRLKDEAIYTIDPPSMFVACNRYARQDVMPYYDKSIRMNSSAPYIYDNDINFDDPASTLDGLEFLLLTKDNTTHFADGHEVVLKKGTNVVTSDAGNVTVTYGVDTKTYIDNKFAALSAALLGG